VRFDWSVRSWFLTQAALAGLGTRSTVEGLAGSAQVAQAYGLLGGSFRFRAGARLRPFATLSAGVLRTSVEGRADAPNQGRVLDQWSFLADVGLGAALRLPDRFTLSLAAHAQLAEPYPAVRFVGAVVATSARPNLLPHPHHRGVAVRRARRRTWLTLAGLIVAASCSRADLDAITRPPAGDGGPDTGTPVTCPSPALPPNDTTETLQVDGRSRSYVLHLPAAYDGSKRVPLLLDFHALASSGAQQQGISPYPAQTDPDGAVMASRRASPVPRDGLERRPVLRGERRRCRLRQALVAKVSTTACIDPKRVYAAGVLHRRRHGPLPRLPRGRRVRGGGVLLLRSDAREYRRLPAVPPDHRDLLPRHRGPLVPYDGGLLRVVPGMPVTFLGAQGTFQKWADIDQCTGSPSAPDSNGARPTPLARAASRFVLCTDPAGGRAQSDAAHPPGPS
jgi:polyhydroxybutyrate depolymerase